MGNTITTKYLGGMNANVYVPYSAILSIDTYATGGVSIHLNGFNPTILVGCEKVSGTPFVIPEYNAEQGKLLLFGANGTEISSLPSAVTIHLTFFGQVQ